MAETGVGVLDIEFVRITPEFDVAALQPFLRHGVARRPPPRRISGNQPYRPCRTFTCKPVGASLAFPRQAPGHRIGFNDLKAIEVRDVLLAVAGGPARGPDFSGGHEIRNLVETAYRPAREKRWIDIRQGGAPTGHAAGQPTCRCRKTRHSGTGWRGRSTAPRV